MTQPTSPMVPSVGRVVHYVPFKGGVCRSADVTEIPSSRNPEARVGLFIKHSTSYQFISLEQGGVPYSDKEPRVPGTWHWPERV